MVAKEEIRKLVESVYIRLKEREYDLKDLAFSMMLSKSPNNYQSNPQHVKAARMLEEVGCSLGTGDIISYIVKNRQRTE